MRPAGTVWRLLAVGLLLLPSISPAAAGAELTSSIGFRFGGDVDSSSVEDTTLDPALSYGLTCDIPLKPETFMAVLWSRQEAEADLPGFDPEDESFDLMIDYLQVGGVYRPDRGHKSSPFVMFSLGIARVDADLGGFGSDIVPAGMIGGGSKISLGQRLGLRLDARGYFVFDTAALKGICGGIGCEVRFAADGSFQFEGLVGVTYTFGTP